MTRLSAAFSALLLVLACVLVRPAPAAAASSQICFNSYGLGTGGVFLQARVCVNYIPPAKPIGYYLVESTRVWNPCASGVSEYAIMKFWANDGTYYSVYTGAIGCGQTYIKSWPYPRVANPDSVYF